MTQQEKANEVLDQLFRIDRNNRVGLSEKFLRAYAPTKWVAQGVQLSADVLICEINKRVWMGSFMRYKRGSVWFYRLNRHRLSYRKKKERQPGVTLASCPDCPDTKPTGGLIETLYHALCPLSTDRRKLWIAVG